MLTLDHGEEKILVLRRHWFVILEHSVFIVLTLGMSIAAALVVGGLSIPFPAGNPGALLVFTIALFCLSAWVAFFVEWTNYYLDIWVVTNRRILDIEQHSFFTREVSEFRLDRVQDITVQVRGLLAEFFDFGDVHVQTAGERHAFIISNAPHPYRVKEVITKAIDRAVEGSAAKIR